MADLDGVPRLMERRFASTTPKWGRGDRLDSSVEQWRDVYEKIEEVRANPNQEQLSEFVAFTEFQDILRGQRNPSFPLVLVFSADSD